MVYILDLVGDGLQVPCMTTDDWCQAQRADPVLSLMIARMQDGTLDQSLCKPTNLPGLHMLLPECNHLKLRWSILYRKLLPKDSKEAQFQLALLATHQEATLRGCHNEVGHFDLECMLDLMCDHFFDLRWLPTQRSTLRGALSASPSR